MLAIAATGPAVAGDIAPVEVTLVKDLDPSTGIEASDPRAFMANGDRVYFTAFTPATGRELFSTDGTPGGLQLVRDLAPGGASSFARLLGAVGSDLVVAADDGANRVAQVWSVAANGSTAQLLASHSYADGPLAAFTPLATIGGKVVFALPDGRRLWATDGTPAGTVDISGTLGAATQIFAQEACVLDAAAIVPLVDDAGQRRLVAIDGTAAGTRSVAALDPVHPMDDAFAVRSGDQCYFAMPRYHDGVVGWALWRSDGTVAGSARIAGDDSGWPVGLAQAGGLVHVALVGINHYRLLRQAPGADTFEEIAGAATSGGWSSLASAGGVLGYAAPFADGIGWRIGYYLSDGTDVGTRRVYASPNVSPQASLTVLSLNNGFVFYRDGNLHIDAATGVVSTAPEPQVARLESGARLGPHIIAPGYDEGGMEVWRSDGTVPGTARLHDVWATTAHGIARDVSSIESAVAGERVYFAGADDMFSFSTWREPLWTTDGTEGGTRRLVDGLAENGRPEAMVPVAGGVVFQNRLSPGFAATVYLADETLTHATALSPLMISPARLMPVGDGAVFGCESGDLCRVGADGSPVGTVVTNVANGRRVVPVGTVGGVAVFLADRDGDVWRSDGTAPGTFRLLAANRTEEFDEVAPASTVFGGKLYFNGCRVPGECSLIATDGTVAGTAAVAPLPVDYIISFAALGDRLVFATFTGSVLELWRTDGTAQGTQSLLSQSGAYVSDVARVGDRAHVLFGCGIECAAAYVVTDGTPAGTRTVAWPAGAPAPAGGFMAALGEDVAVYSCRLPQTGIELCATDPEAQGVRMLADRMPGPLSSRPMLIGATPTTLYVALDDGAHGREPWRLRVFGDAIFANGFEVNAR